MIRKAAVAGSFYPAEPDRLIAFFDGLGLKAAESGLPAKAIVVPHAGYQYSGQLAGQVYSVVRLPRRFVILCPNHTGMGAPLATISEGAWETPLGEAAIDQDLARAISEAYPPLEESPAAHRFEHSLEVQLPFLQYLLENEFRFVPICIGTGSYETLIDFGLALGDMLARWSDPVLMVSSSDMNHFESAEVTIRKDEMAIDRIIQLDSKELYETVKRERISMCGYAPTIIAIEASKKLGASEGVLIGHTHSGAVTGETHRVVGYAGIALC
ncbi:MAG TPA: AmmeMemoRadiSam system protein B [Acidobacteriota bacterium]|nr:AmmeMemoRadiSam system protein B [Acidobacteriota bacterium]